jgi:hypothetical protein
MVWQPLVMRRNAEIGLEERKVTESVLVSGGCDQALETEVDNCDLATAHGPFGSRDEPFVPQGKQECLCH